MRNFCGVHSMEVALQARSKKGFAKRKKEEGRERGVADMQTID